MVGPLFGTTFDDFRTSIFDFKFQNKFFLVLIENVIQITKY